MRNMIRCKGCGDIIESKYEDELIRCSCGSCAVTGGQKYMIRILRYNARDPRISYEELSKDEIDKNKYLTVDEAVKKYFTTSSTIRRKIRMGEIKGCVMYKNRWYIPVTYDPEEAEKSPNGYMSIKEKAKEAGMSESFIRNQKFRGQIPENEFLKVKNKLYLPSDFKIEPRRKKKEA